MVFLNKWSFAEVSINKGGKMKRSITFLVLLFLLLLASCDKGLVIYDDESAEKTANIRSLYLKHLYGSWKSTEISPFFYIEQHYDFKPNDKVNGHLLLMARDTITINGKMNITDWKKIIDVDVTGEWSLLHKSSVGKNLLYFNVHSQYAGNQYLDFIHVNDSILEIQSPMILTKIIRMRRK